MKEIEDISDDELNAEYRRREDERAKQAMDAHVAAMKERDQRIETRTKRGVLALIPELSDDAYSTRCTGGSR